MRRSWLGAALLPLLAACGSGNHGTTVPFDSVVVGPPPAPTLAKLVFEAVPRTVGVNDTMPPVLVDVKDANNKLLDVSDTVVLTLDNNPARAQLGGQTLGATSHGVATFHGLRIDAAGAGYTLRASAVNRISGISDTITVTP